MYSSSDSKAVQGLMNYLECRPFEKEHIEAAKQIALGYYLEEKEIK